MMEYTLNDISGIVKRSQQSLYKLIRDNDELRSIVEANSRETGKNRIKMYGVPVLQWFINHYKVSYTIEDHSGEAETSAIAESNGADHTENKALQQKVKRLRRKVKRLEAENERLIEENQSLLTMLQKEQEQRQGLLMSLFAEKHQKLLNSTKRHWWNKKD